MKNWTMDRIINKISKPYPLVFPTTFDFVPLMSFQQVVDPDLPLRQFNGSVSVLLGGKRDTFPSRDKDHEIEYTVDTLNPQQTNVKFNGNSTITQKTLWNQIQDDLGADSDFTELNTAMRITEMKAPNTPSLGVNSFYLVQNKTGNFTGELKRRFGLQGIRNPYYEIRNDLKENGLWRKQYRHKLRGVLKTTNMIGNDGNKLVPWQNILLVPKDHRFPPEMTSLNEELINGKWWGDSGVPVRLLGNANSFDVEAVIYMLKKRRVLITA